MTDEDADQANAEIQRGCCVDTKGREDPHPNRTEEWTDEERNGFLRQENPIETTRSSRPHISIQLSIANFKLPFIQEQTPDQSADATTGRPCVAGIRFYGAMDDGLVDVRPDIELWGLEEEIKRWEQLYNLPEHATKSKLEISEMVLAEDWPSKLRRQHIEALGTDGVIGG